MSGFQARRQPVAPVKVSDMAERVEAQDCSVETLVLMESRARRALAMSSSTTTPLSSRSTGSRPWRYRAT